MDLIDILRRDLKHWPEKTYFAYQGHDGHVFFLDTIANYDNGGHSWEYGARMVSGPTLQKADDLEYSHVLVYTWEKDDAMVQ